VAVVKHGAPFIVHVEHVRKNVNRLLLRTNLHECNEFALFLFIDR
jgi:hypothetical protein